MRFKKIYIEITNACNLNCSFCIKNKRKINYITLENYKFIINKIKPYTKEIYLHILGEPLLHPNINEFIEYAQNQDLLVNITTNGYLITNLNTNKIHRLNISLHSYNENYKKKAMADKFAEIQQKFEENRNGKANGTKQISAVNRKLIVAMRDMGVSYNELQEITGYPYQTLANSYSKGKKEQKVTEDE